MKNVKIKMRLSRLAAACISAALLIGAMSGLTYAATGGATVNPVSAVKIYLNGAEYKGSAAQNSDGTYTVHVEAGDNLDVISEDGSASSVIWENGSGYVNISENGDNEVVITNTGDDGTDDGDTELKYHQE